MPARRNDRVAPPGPPNGWEARFATNDASKGWEQLVTAARSNAWEAFVVLTTRPTDPENRTRQHRLKGRLGTHEIHGKILEQWQYEVTARQAHRLARRRIGRSSEADGVSTPVRPGAS